MTKELEHQLRLERSRVDKRADELVAFLDIQREHQTVSDAQLSLAETQFMLLETYYVLINRRIKDLKRKRG
ncbi:hypothetical protein [Limosilactobacillus mucosae]|uniref:Uncharacterized protein n=1 Tax=Limosilactobacillus mucosae TaxID=97478 RepID=A0A099YDV0_LIMMU|nr:hypothetical protein LX03_03935 [Limosilactobacillus mucosae]